MEAYYPWLYKKKLNSCAEGSLVVIATDIHFYPTSERRDIRLSKLLQIFKYVKMISCFNAVYNNK